MDLALTPVDRQRKAFSLAGAPEAHGAAWLILDLAPRKRGSMEQELVALGERLYALGVPATFVFSAPPAPWLADAFAAARVRVRTADFRRPRAMTLALGATLFAARPALVHFHFVRAYAPIVALAKLAGARVIVNDHLVVGGDRAAGWRRTAKRLRARMLNRLVDCRLAVSDAVAASARRNEWVRPEAQAVIENGVDLERFANVDGAALRRELGAEGRPLVVCVGRLIEDKGVSTLVRALKLVGRDAVLAFAGVGPEEPALRALVAELGLADHVRFLGLRHDTERLYAAADVVAAPSLCDEAFGLAVVEAMAVGRPVVVSAAGALPDVVDHGAAGLVVPKRDAVALAGAINRLLGDPGYARRLGDAAQARARARYGMPLYVERTVRLYRQLAPELFADERTGAAPDGRSARPGERG